MQKVLVINDSAAIHGQIRDRLSNEAVEVHYAVSGVDGLALAAALHPDLILLDVEMEGIDGFEVCRRLKQDPATLGIPVIFLSGVSSTEERIKGLELGAVDYVSKPFDLAELRARVRGALRTKYLMDLLARKGMIDGLTGLWNRAHFDDRLASEVAAITRSPRPLGCVMADIDNFKFVNDTHGHLFGDEVLRGVAQILQEVSRAEDVVCRFGGEEFVILTPGIGLIGATSFAQRARAAIEDKTFSHDGREAKVTCSFGVSDASVAGFKRLVEEADSALYRAKHTGRNCVVDAREAA